MTTAAARPAHQIPVRRIGVALAGAVLAVATGFGIAAMVLDEAPAGPSSTEYPGTDTGTGTDRQLRELMHRNP